MTATVSFRDTIPDDIRENLAPWDDLTAKLLFHRGFTTKEQVEKFLAPAYDRDLHDPFLMHDMEKVVLRTIQALKNKEKIAIYSDYDCDGIPGGVLLHDLFTTLGADFENYIPHRHDEGYGFHAHAVEALHARGASLIITVDCGITDIAAAACAEELGVDVVITDHHLPQATLPSVYAILNPKLSHDQYPFKDLCGSGIAWKFASALLSRVRKDTELAASAPREGWEKWLLDMAGLATIADMVPLQGENRVLAYYGLIVLRKTSRPGLRALYRAVRLNERMMTEDDIGFLIGPRINAASRMGEPMEAFKLLTTRDEVYAKELASKLEKINRTRKSSVATITKEVKHRLSLRSEITPVIAIGNPEWRPALLGLVANSLVEEYQRPVFLWGTEGNNTLKGSCRSDGVTNLVDLMVRTEEIFIEFGGHALSGGFSLSREAVFHLEEKLSQTYLSMRDDAPSLPPTLVDGELSLLDVSESTMRKIEKLAPFGEGNPKPVFVFRDVVVCEVSWFGKNGEHIRLVLEQDGNRAHAMAFFAERELGSTVRNIEVESKLSFSASLDRDAFARGRVRLRLSKLI
jgi:single-stranded-DNA-specific exonuclease